jgi:hypothetical protein
VLSSDHSPSALDGAYHYPPDLLELLTDAIPALFKSKQAVIDFFQGAGTPGVLLSGWRHKLRTEKDAVKKHEITRDVLRALNEGGDTTLSARREVIKRVSEFEDFSTCWDNDRLKAQALAAKNKDHEHTRMVHVRPMAWGRGTVR